MKTFAPKAVLDILQASAGARSGKLICPQHNLFHLPLRLRPGWPRRAAPAAVPPSGEAFGIAPTVPARQRTSYGRPSTPGSHRRTILAAGPAALVGTISHDLTVPYDRGDLLRASPFLL